MINKIINQNCYSQFQDYQLWNQDEEYLSEQEEEQWQNDIFKNMQLQVIQEATSVVEDVSRTTSELTRTNLETTNNKVVPAEERHCRRKGKPRTH